MPDERQTGQLFDPGVQLERTHLAWSRTALAFAADAALTGRASERLHPAGLAIAITITLALAAGGASWYGRHSYSARSTALHQGHSPARPHVLRIVAGATTALAVLTAAVVSSTLLRA